MEALFNSILAPLAVWAFWVFLILEPLKWALVLWLVDWVSEKVLKMVTDRVQTLGPVLGMWMANHWNINALPPSPNGDRPGMLITGFVAGALGVGVYEVAKKYLPWFGRVDRIIEARALQRCLQRSTGPSP